MVETSNLVDYFRKTDKANSVLISLFDKGDNFTILAIPHYELYSGNTSKQIPFWEGLLKEMDNLVLDQKVAQTAVI